MERPYTLRAFLSCSFLAAMVPSVWGQVHALMTISNLPEIERGQGDLFIYAIYNDPSDVDSAEIIKLSGELPLEVRGVVEVGPHFVGGWLRLPETNRLTGTRYGRYEASYSFGNGKSQTGETFVKPRTELLDTRGVYTVTIYPKENAGTDLAEAVSIGVKLTTGCNKIIWCKGRKRNVHTGPRMTLTSVKDAGLYTIARPGRGERGWFVQIRVTASPCQRGWYRNDGGVCVEGTSCMNGGVLKSDENGCFCPPFFFGVDCSSTSRDHTPDPFVLVSLSPSDKLYCRDLPGGDPKCKGYLVCMGDNYGCKCAPGWWGNACDKPCSKLRYGPGCDQRCSVDSTVCDRFFGPVYPSDGPDGEGSGDMDMEA